MLHPAGAAGKGQSGPGTTEGPWGNRARWPHAPRVRVRGQEQEQGRAREPGNIPSRAPAPEKSKASCGTGGMSMQKASERGDLK